LPHFVVERFGICLEGVLAGGIHSRIRRRQKA
jgi:hypothetical protein